jgi:predicted nucleic acid-binding Zn ribbon protein
MKQRNNKIPTICKVCSQPVKPNNKGLYNLTCSEKCKAKLRSINATKNVKKGTVRAFNPTKMRKLT